MPAAPAPADELLLVFDHRIEPALLSQIAAMEALAFAQPWGAQSLHSTLAQVGSGLAVICAADAPEQAPLSFCLYQQVVDEMSILQIATAPAARRRGHGLRLIRFVQQVARDGGCRQLFLEVRRGNTPALGLYAAAGFTEQGVRRGYYADNGEDALLLCCPLAPAS